MPPKKVTRIPTETTSFTAENPEFGYWWHTLDAAGRRAFEDHDEKFGKKTSESTNTRLQDTRLIRCRPSINEIKAWLSNFSKTTRKLVLGQQGHLQRTRFVPFSISLRIRIKTPSLGQIP